MTIKSKEDAKSINYDVSVYLPGKQLHALFRLLATHGFLWLNQEQTKTVRSTSVLIY